MSAPTLEQKIHFTKGLKVPRVKITRATRSATGFYVVEKISDGVEIRKPCQSKKEALQYLLAQIRCITPKSFTVRTGRSK